MAVTNDSRRAQQWNQFQDPEDGDYVEVDEVPASSAVAESAAGGGDVLELFATEVNVQTQHQHELQRRATTPPVVHRPPSPSQNRSQTPPPQPPNTRAPTPPPQQQPQTLETDLVPLKDANPENACKRLFRWLFCCKHKNE